MDPHLPHFIKFLEENGLVEFDILGDTEAHFLNRFKIQKHVFIAKKFGLEFPYYHSMYLRGPYSKSLTTQYYELANDKPALYDPIQISLPNAFDHQGFLAFVNTKSEGWLEIATTLMKRNEVIDDRNDLIENVSNIKDGYSTDFISDVLTTLETSNLVRIHH